MGIMKWLERRKSNQIQDLPQVSTQEIFDAIKELEDKIASIEDEKIRDKVSFGTRAFIKLMRESTIITPSISRTKDDVNYMYNNILSEIRKTIKRIDDSVIKETGHTK